MSLVERIKEETYPWINLLPENERRRFPLPIIDENDMKEINERIMRMIEVGRIKGDIEEVYPLLMKLSRERIERKIEAIERRLREVSPYLENEPVVTVKVSNVPKNVMFKWTFPEEGEDINILFDYVINAKSIPMPLARLVKGRALGIRLVVDVPKRFGGGAEERGYLIDIRNRMFHFLKPDFLKYDINQSKRWIPHRRGRAQLVMEIEYINGSKDAIKVLDLEVEWVRYGKPLREMAREGVIAWKTARRIEERMRRRGINAFGDKNLWGVLRYRVWVRGKSQKQGKIIMLAWTKEISPKRLIFGNQEVYVVERRRGDPGWMFEKDGENISTYEFKPFNHRVKGWIIKRYSNDENEGCFQIPTFDVYKFEGTDFTMWRVVPRTPTMRLILESAHHWGEGLGRVLINVGRGEEVVFVHRRPLIVKSLDGAKSL